MSSYLFILRYDSFIKTFLPVIKKLEQNNEVTVVLFEHFIKKPWISKQIESLLNDVKTVKKKYPGLLKLLKKEDYDVITFGFTGGSLMRRINLHLKKNNKKSKIVTGYIGALLNNSDYFFKKGVRNRSVSDLIFVPGPDSKKDVVNTGLIDEKRTEVLASGLPRFDDLFDRIQKWDKNRVQDTILFLEQPTFPESEEERELLVDKLIELANIYKNMKVVIKPRFGLKTGHAHRPKYLLPEILGNKNHGENIIVSYDDIYDLYYNASMVLTISSTGGLESMLAGIPSYFITDFCKDQNLYGSQYFKKTGALVSFKNLFERNLPTIDYDKAQEIFLFDGKNGERLTNALIKTSEE